MKTLHIYREFAIYQITVVCASVTVQTFFAYRVYSLSTNLYLGILVEVLVLLQFGFGAITAIKANIILDFKLVVKECTWLIVIWLAIQAVADVVIATSMCILLRSRRTGFQRTDSIINHLVVYTISTGLVTGILSCVVLVLFAKDGFEFSVLILSVPLDEARIGNSPPSNELLTEKQDTVQWSGFCWK
ncbi:hypothetical protein BS47DRAFT_1197148 [Hydnum rufescens UP504]|uniref:DUF6534 domain-containing protein n=1 Tax=Hydnum rufescens UP504 TaxID=1448309 RepID=A0A9P6ASN9_9AGAM|nr:hypothetical protein BS47DRAFT_1197148 [Hydnum rufescens UP504]